MRLQGRVTEWNDERGFGFVTQNSTGQRFFLHISQLASRRTRPSLGEVLTFEVGQDERGRLQARNARRAGDPLEDRSGNGMAARRQARNTRTAAARFEDRSGSGIGGLLMTLAVVVALGYLAYVRLSAPNSTVAASAYKIVFERDALRFDPAFKCSPEKNSCSKMTSCAEALFHQERCDVPNMDGDRDGIPCEQQWCR